MGIIGSIRKIAAMLPPSLTRRAILLLVMMVAVALLETVGVVSVVPFIAVASRPQLLHENQWLNMAYEASGATSEYQFLIYLGIMVFLLLVVSNAFKVLSTWQINAFSYLTGKSLSTRLIEAYLSQPYSYFLGRNSAELAKNVLVEVQTVVSEAVQPAMIAIARLAVALSLAAVLIFTDPLLAVSVVAFFGLTYGVLYGLLRARIARLGVEDSRANEDRFLAVSEAFAGIKEVKLRGLEQSYTARYTIPAQRYARLRAWNQTMSQVPRYFIEALAFGSVVLLVIYLLSSGGGGMAEVLPTIAIYAFAGYRLLPISQEIFGALTRIRFSQSAVDLLYRDYMEKTAVQAADVGKTEPVAFERDIRLDNLSYRYPSGDRVVVRNVDLSIRKGARAGFVGPTGSGKSTIIDLMLGLLQPAEGRVLVDGQDINAGGRLRGWQCQIGYVPQHIFLADDTIAANIAFGAKEAPDLARVERVARMAQIHDFIASELPEKYQTNVGEGGIRLSGGQRQRLGLARALYGDPAVLIFDEATSALDNKTEDDVMAALDRLQHDCTVIMIAHRLRTLSKCDVVFEVSGGRITRTGSFADVVGEDRHDGAA